MTDTDLVTGMEHAQWRIKDAEKDLAAFMVELSLRQTPENVPTVEYLRGVDDGLRDQ